MKSSSWGWLPCLHPTNKHLQRELPTLGGASEHVHTAQQLPSRLQSSSSYSSHSCASSSIEHCFSFRNGDAKLSSKSSPKCRMSFLVTDCSRPQRNARTKRVGTWDKARPRNHSIAPIQWNQMLGFGVYAGRVSSWITTDFSLAIACSRSALMRMREKVDAILPCMKSVTLISP